MAADDEPAALLAPLALALALYAVAWALDGRPEGDWEPFGDAPVGSAPPRQP